MPKLRQWSKPAKTLADGRKKAARLDNPSDQAWAMRDTFDGLLDVVKRWSGPTGKPPAKRETPHRKN